MKKNNEDFLNEIYVQLKEIHAKIDKAIDELGPHEGVSIWDIEDWRDEIKKITKRYRRLLTFRLQCAMMVETIEVSCCFIVVAGDYPNKRLYTLYSEF